MIVDTHTHVVADDATRYPLDPRPGTHPWYRDSAHSVESLLELMDAAAVARAVLVQAVGAYRHDNRYVLDAARTYPDRTVSVVCPDLDAPGAPESLRQAVVDHDAHGLRWWAIDGASLGEPRAVWDEVGRLALPVVVTTFATRLGELLALVPTLPPVPLAIDHCAFADLSRGVPDVLLALSAHANVHWKVSTIVLDGLAEHGDVRDGLAELVAGLGPDRVMWGSDFSQTNDRPYAALVDLARHASSRLSDETRAAFLGENALRIFFA